MLSDSPPDRDVIWSEEGVQGATRFLQRVWRLVSTAAPTLPPPGTRPNSGDHKSAQALRVAAHQALSDVETGIERLRFNTAIAKLYSFVGAIAEIVDDPARPLASDAVLAAATREAFDILVPLIAPMMPHLAEECWAALGHTGLVSQAAWPELDSGLLVTDTITLPVQVNGKKRGDIEVGRSATATEIEAAVLALDAVKTALGGKAVRKVIVVPQRIVNVVG